MIKIIHSLNLNLCCDSCDKIKNDILFCIARMLFDSDVWSIFDTLGYYERQH